MLLNLKVSRRANRLFLELNKPIRDNFKAGEEIKIKVLKKNGI